MSLSGELGVDCDVCRRVWVGCWGGLWYVQESLGEVLGVDTGMCRRAWVRCWGWAVVCADEFWLFQAGRMDEESCETLASELFCQQESCETLESELFCQQEHASLQQWACP